jgi:GDPmannose 4,6-dehydratase
VAEATHRALVTGLTGQDGSYLAELLLAEGYAVTGVVRGWPRASLGAAEHLRGQVDGVPGDLLAPESLRAAVREARPHELYHLAAPSFVPASWERPAETCAAIVDATAALLEAVREVDPRIRVFAAGTGAIFGDAGESPQREETCRRPETPYAIAKLAAHNLVGAMRDHDGLYACSGILYNHESERRSERFVTRKLTRAAAEVELGLTSEVEVGDLDTVRDWSFAGDVMRGAWLMLQQDEPRDLILSSGEPHTVAEWARAAFACVGRDAERHLRVHDELLRASETTPMVGDPTRALERLGWRSEVGFEQLVERMVRADLEGLRATVGSHDQA